MCWLRRLFAVSSEARSIDTSTCALDGAPGSPTIMPLTFEVFPSNGSTLSSTENTTAFGAPELMEYVLESARATRPSGRVTSRTNTARYKAARQRTSGVARDTDVMTLVQLASCRFQSRRSATLRQRKPRADTPHAHPPPSSALWSGTTRWRA